MTLLNELQLADRLGCFESLDDTQKKRRVRAMIRKSGVKPIIPDRDTWLIPEQYLSTILETLCLSSSPKEKARPSGMSAATLEELRSSKARAQLRKSLRTATV